MKIENKIVFYILTLFLISGFGQVYAAISPDPIISADLKALFAEIILPKPNPANSL